MTYMYQKFHSQPEEAQSWVHPESTYENVISMISPSITWHLHAIYSIVWEQCENSDKMRIFWALHSMHMHIQMCVFAAVDPMTTISTLTHCTLFGSSFWNGEIHGPVTFGLEWKPRYYCGMIVLCIDSGCVWYTRNCDIRGEEGNYHFWLRQHMDNERRAGTAVLRCVVFAV